MSILVELPPDQYDRRAFAKFNETSTGFDLDIARAMMWMSQLAYETHVPDTINRISPFWDLSGVKLLSQPPASCIYLGRLRTASGASMRRPPHRSCPPRSTSWVSAVQAEDPREVAPTRPGRRR